MGNYKGVYKQTNGADKVDYDGITCLNILPACCQDSIGPLYAVRHFQAGKHKYFFLLCTDCSQFPWVVYKYSETEA